MTRRDCLPKLRDVVGGAGHRDGEAVRGERDRSMIAHLDRKGADRVGQIPRERLDEAGMVVELAQLVDHRSARPD